MKTLSALCYLDDLWDEKIASGLDEPELLRYRSNLLGADLRITNFGGGNTSSKIAQPDPLTGEPAEVLWVKGSGGDLGSIQRRGFATLYMNKLLALEGKYQGVSLEDAMVELYPLCTFGQNPVAASIDTPLHGFLPFPHVDHLHPDWAIALAAAANGKSKMDEFNREYGHSLVWLPWQRPGFELGLMLRRIVAENPGCDGVVLGGHGLFTWGDTQRLCYLNTITMIDHLGQFVQEHMERKGAAIFGGAVQEARADRKELALDLLPFVRGRVSQQKRLIGSFCDLPEVLKFVNSKDAAALAHLGTSCPDHFIRTKIRPLFVPAEAADDAAAIRTKIEAALKTYGAEYTAYYKAHAEPDSPAMRDANPTVVLVAGVGMFSFGRSRTESRIVGEFYTNAIHVMEGATALGDGKAAADVPQAGPAAPCEAFKVHANYVALPVSEAFRIEYWALEEAKIRRQPAEKELSRQIALIVGGASGIGRAVALLAAERGAHVMIADRDLAGSEKTAKEAAALAGKEATGATAVDIRNRDTVFSAIRATVAQFGGLDILINTAAIFPSSPDGVIGDAMWATTLDLNVTANYLLADEAAKIFAAQNIDASIVLTSSANAVVPKRGSEVYDVSKAALSHLVRELAVGLSPKVRVNGISPATVVKGSTMFPRDRVMSSLTKYNIAFDAASTDDELRNLLATFYAKRTLTHQPIDPNDCAQAILFLAGPHARCTSGHLIPVDGGLPEAFLR
ncbi:bifunctional rhamnulose-1-phosphate aldolase/short-chain dehydrogenase [Paracidobacterium acidisoli]|uniref:Bifunctional rhamnulose-1-phosphate aldolase/short-chain dehydrogenase n=1 Tax=Paracidobacterium acidisoli TaxID=2303751 RepID=A0A372IK49_9BACT|nr:bifunctional rhamnulose-1-phosphate aldolase/short-chain dehydrogenase [Paracidobacterium acidisoli]MBT9332582.1 bifunctional rhamnulose-1-phosphate aldolase/short-chain dehydrogenase [Paracidobacterium acidisoli]